MGGKKGEFRHYYDRVLPEMVDFLVSAIGRGWVPQEMLELLTVAPIYSSTRKYRSDITQSVFWWVFGVLMGWPDRVMESILSRKDRCIVKYLLLNPCVDRTVILEECGMSYPELSGRARLLFDQLRSIRPDFAFGKKPDVGWVWENYVDACQFLWRSKAFVRKLRTPSYELKSIVADKVDLPTSVVVQVLRVLFDVLSALWNHDYFTVGPWRVYVHRVSHSIVELRLERVRVDDALHRTVGDLVYGVKRPVFLENEKNTPSA